MRCISEKGEGIREPRDTFKCFIL